mmetsp:Transcript_29292/g.66352  ORF Transcript_29292/g.66352 Transcript_29292/m.66352 type:complete len:260 (-) Transcript_29292:887-1666(-)
MMDHLGIRTIILLIVMVLLPRAGGSSATTPNVCQCDLTWNPVCGAGIVAQQVTFMNSCFSKCSCNMAEQTTCNVQKGECPFQNQSKLCPQIPWNLDISIVYLELSKNPSTFNLVVDVRTAEEYVGESKNHKIGHIPGAILVESLADNPSAADILLPCKNVSILLVCRTGVRSLAAAKILQQQGYPCVFNMDGGTLAWYQAGFPTAKGAPNNAPVLDNCTRAGPHPLIQTSKGEIIRRSGMMMLLCEFFVFWKICLLFRY